MSNLIPLHHTAIGTEAQQTVNARELHTFLGPKARFNDWIARRIATYGFQEDRDFTVLKNEYGPDGTIEYHVSLDMAKELSMVERTRKGKEARLYFLACEKAALARTPSPQLPAPRETLDTLHACRSALQDLGCFDDRDTIMFAAYVRRIAATAMQPLLPAGSSDPLEPDLTQPVLWTLSMRMQFLKYPPLTGADGPGQQIKIGTLAKKAYATEFGEEPKKLWDFVKGQQRQVNAYAPDRVHVLDQAIETVLGPPRLQLITTT